MAGYAEKLASHGLLQHVINLVATALPENASAALIEMTPTLVELLLLLLGLAARHSSILCSQMIDLGLPMVLQGLIANEVGASTESFDSCDRGSSGAAGSGPEHFTFMGAGSPITSSSSVTGRRRSRSLSFGGSSPRLGQGGSSDVLVHLLALLLDLLPPLPFNLHPLAQENHVSQHASSSTAAAIQESEQREDDEATSSSSSSSSVSRMRLEGDACYVRVVYPHGLPLTMELEGRHGMQTVATLDLGTVLRAQGWTRDSNGVQRYSTSYGWISARSGSTDGHNSNPSTYGKVICEVADGEGHAELAQAKRELLAKKETLSSPILSMIPHLLELYRSAARSTLRILCASVVRAALNGMPTENMKPLIEEDPQMVSQLASLVARLSSVRRSATGVGSGESMRTLTGLGLGLLLLEKAPAEFANALQREGLVAQAQELRKAAVNDANVSRGEAGSGGGEPPMSPLLLPVPMAGSPPADLALGASPSSSYLAASIRARQEQQQQAAAAARQGGGGGGGGGG